jgi:hypothetical protein
MTLMLWLLGLFLRLNPKGMLAGKLPAVMIWSHAARQWSQIVAVLQSPRVKAAVR